MYFLLQTRIPTIFLSKDLTLNFYISSLNDSALSLDIAYFFVVACCSYMTNLLSFLYQCSFLLHGFLLAEVLGVLFSLACWPLRATFFFLGSRTLLSLQWDLLSLSTFLRGNSVLCVCLSRWALELTIQVSFEDPLPSNPFIGSFTP